MSRTHHTSEASALRHSDSATQGGSLALATNLPGHGLSGSSPRAGLPLFYECVDNVGMTPSPARRE
jgi:hypothetical protein